MAPHDDAPFSGFEVTDVAAACVADDRHLMKEANRFKDVRDDAMRRLELIRGSSKMTFLRAPHLPISGLR